MSEHAPNTHEQQEALPSPEKHELLAARNKREKQTATVKAEAAHKLASEARKNISETASNHHNALKQLEASEEAPQASVPRTINKDLKRITLKRELKSIQRKLPKNEQRLSKVVHQPVIRVASEAAGKTITRPSGMLGGGLVAFLGSLSYLYLTKHIGFTYNYFVFFVLFAGGYVVGVVLELIVNMAMSSQRRARD